MNAFFCGRVRDCKTLKDVHSCNLAKKKKSYLSFLKFFCASIQSDSLMNRIWQQIAFQRDFIFNEYLPAKLFLSLQLALQNSAPPGSSHPSLPPPSCQQSLASLLSLEGGGSQCFAPFSVKCEMILPRHSSYRLSTQTYPTQSRPTYSTTVL